MADTANITLKGESEAINFIDEALRGDIAYEELSTTVSKTGGYVAGDHLIYLGQYYEVVADIAQGGTIVTSGAGQNVEEREVGDEIKKNKTQVLGVICDVETSPATAAHSAGDQFYYDGALVEATSAIAIGDTIVVSPDTGYNVKVADKVVAQIQTLTNQSNSMVNVLGAKNLLENELESTVVDKVNIIRNPNGTLSVSTNGEVESAQQDILIHRNFVPPVSGQYKLTGAYNQNVILIAFDITASTWLESDRGSGVVLSLDQNHRYNFLLVVIANTTLSTPVTVSPMLRPNRIAEDTYVPYAMTNQQMTPYVQAISNPNLLDNPWFTVNQRGETSSYFADRWRRFASELTFTNNDGVTISGTLSSIENLGKQDIEWDRLKDNIGKSITLSVLIDGTVYKAVGEIATPTSSWKGHASLEIPSLNIWFQLLTYGTSPSVAELYIKNINTDAINVTIRAIKLELGSVSTLAMDTAPNYTTELLKCQRYFYKTLQFNDNGMNISPNQCLAVSATRLQGIKFPVQMRTNPNVTVNKVNELGGSVTISGVAAQRNSKEGISYFSITGATVGSLYIVDFEASADL